jgi:hypothetical protein
MDMAGGRLAESIPFLQLHIIFVHLHYEQRTL